MVDLKLACDCGKVQGIARGVSPGNGNRLICYCNSCQAFAHKLGRSDKVLNDYGGTDVYQLTPAQVTITAGSDNLACLRLTEKGLYRWYTRCCKTPIGNTVGAGFPMVGLIHNFFDKDERKDTKLGPVRGSVYVNNANGEPPPHIRGNASQWVLTIRVIRKLLSWKIKGLANPHPFFTEEGAPVVQPEIVG